MSNIFYQIIIISFKKEGEKNRYTDYEKKKPQIYKPAPRQKGCFNK